MKKKVLLSCLCLIMMAALSVGVLSGCKVKNPQSSNDGPVNYGVDGVYYCDTENGEFLIELDGEAFSWTFGGDAVTGNFTFDGRTVTFTAASGEQTVASLKDGELTVTQEGVTYKFLEKVNYTVTFDVFGEEEVVNGKTVTKPADPQKEGQVFVGWYKESTFKNKFSFTEAITSDVKLFARFISVSAEANVYTATLVVDGEVYGVVETVNGIAYNLPTPEKEGATFAGWWISHEQDAERLTYKYEEQALVQNETLFAVWASDAALVSVSETGVKWESVGAGSSYKVKVTNPDGQTIERTQGTTTYNYNFATKAEGVYTVEVTVNGKTTVAYYVNKALARVSVFTVEENVLVWNPVENAEEYFLTIECAEGSHTHVEQSNGTATTFDFTNCGMKKGGLKFVVYAVGEGFVSSVSSVYVLERNLAAVEGMAFGDDAVLSWNAVENAQAYAVTVNGETFNVNDNYVDLRNYTGDLSVTVTPVAAGYNSPEAVSGNYVKETLAAPTGIKLDYTTVRWNEVEGAVSYKVIVNGKEYNETANAFVLTEEQYGANQESCEISVYAISADGSKNSIASFPVKINFGTMTEAPVYNNGIVSWQPVLNASKFEVKVGSAASVTVDATATECPVAFTAAGEQTISVRCYNSITGEPCEWVTVTVSVYKVTFDANGGKGLEGAEKVQYKVYGDTVEVPTSQREGYDFDAWYNAKVDGAKFNGVTFDGEADTTYYAYWNAKSYDVTLIASYDGQVIYEDVKSVKYDSKYDLGAVDSLSENSIYFGGWYTEPNGIGVRFTDINGTSLQAWKRTEGITLYADWIEVLLYQKVKAVNGVDYVYQVTKGADISSVTEITIPATFNGLPVTTIAASAFENCTKLVKINIPNTIVNIEVNNGGNYTGSAFKGCTALNYVDVYEVEGGVLPTSYYEDYNGVLIYNNEYTGIEIKYYPLGRKGEMIIPDGVTAIPVNCFRNYKFNKIVIPASVTNIDAGAFYGSSVSEIVFLPPAEGQEALPLVIAEKTFDSCANLKVINLPARVAKFDISLFKNCTNLAEINLEEGGENYSSRNGILCSADGTEIIYVPRGVSGEFVVPDGVTTIGPSSFYDLTITRLIVPGSVTEIKEAAFYWNEELVEVVFQGKANDPRINIGVNAFAACRMLTSITFPENTGHVADRAFSSCYNLTHVTVNAIVNAESEEDLASFSFGSSVFGYVTQLVIGTGCPAFDINGAFGVKLKGVTVIEGNPYIESDADGVLFNKGKTEIIYYPTARLGAYVIPETVEVIGDYVFSEKLGLDKITIGWRIKEIGDDAFSYCDRLKEVIFEPTPAGETEVPLVIGENAFGYCWGGEIPELPSRVVEIKKKAFYVWSFMNGVTIPEGVKTVGENVFTANDIAGVIRIPASVEYLGENSSDGFNAVSSSGDMTTAFEVHPDNKNYMSVDGVLYKKDENGNPVKLLRCPGGKTGKVVIPATVTEIGVKAFYYSHVEEIAWEERSEEDEIMFNKHSLYYCRQLKKLPLPVGLTELPEYGIYVCPLIESIEVPYTVTYIASRAIYTSSSYPSNLKEFTFQPLPEGADVEDYPLEIGDASYSIFGTSSTANTMYMHLKSVVLPERTTYLYNAFYGMNHLESVVIPSTVVEIGNNTFAYCRALTSVTINDVANSVLDHIGNTAFRYSAISTITLPDCVTGLGTSVFRDCPNLVSVNAVTEDGTVLANRLPAGIEKIPNYTFMDSPNIKEFFVTKAITLIDAGAFCNVSELETVTFEEGSALNEFDNYAFYNCTALKSIAIPSKVTKIGNQVFADCTSLKSVTFDVNDNGLAAIKTFGSMTFRGSAIESFEFPESSNAITVGANMFMYCTKLETVHVSSDVSTIDGIFDYCAGLTTVTIAANNANLTLVNGAPVISNVAGNTVRFVYEELELTDGVYTIPAQFTTIGAGAFKGQTGITKLIIPATVTEIGKAAFANCVNLKEVEFEESTNWKLANLGTYTFQNCTSLTTITNLPTTVTTIGNYVFDGCTSLASFTAPKVTSTGTYTFQNCTSLESVEFKASSVTFGNYAFAGSGLKSIYISKNVGTYTFMNCKNLEEVTFKGSGVTSFGNYAFQNCTSLKSITVPSTVTKYGNYCFENTALESFEFTNAAATMGSYMFSKCEALASVKLPENLTIVPYGAFSHCSSLESIDFPETVTSIRNMAFEYSGLKTVTIPTGVTVFDRMSSATSTSPSSYSKSSDTFTFQYCTELTTVNLHDKFEKLSGSAFFHCEKLETVNGSEYIKDISRMAFAYTAIKEIDVSSAMSIWHSAFEGCSALTDVTFCDDLTDLSQYLFRYCDSLKTVKLPSALIKVYNGAFYDCHGLESIVIPENVTKIDTGAFRGAINLSSVTFESKNLEEIGNNAFNGCTSLKRIALPTTVTKISYDAFWGSGLETFHFHRALVDLGSEAFAYCTSLTEFTADENHDIYKVVDGMLFDKSTGALAIYPAGKYDEDGKFEFNEEIPDFHSYAFEGAIYITEIVFAPGMITTELYSQMFIGTNIERFVIPEGVTQVGQMTFQDCTNLKEVVFPSTFTTFSMNGAFTNSTSLKTVELPLDSAVTNIPQNTFKNTALESFVVPANVTKLGGNVFEDCVNLKTVYLPTGLIEIGSAAFQNSALETVYWYELDENGEMVIVAENKLPDTIITLGQYVFANTNITSMALPKNLSKIDYYLFSDCSELKSVTIPETIDTLGYYMFMNCTSLETVELHDGIVNLGQYTFQGSGIKNITIPAGVSKIGVHTAVSTSAKPYDDITEKRFKSYVFMDCANLETVTFKHSAEDRLLIGAYSFAGCTSLKNIVLPARTEIIGGNAFSGCTALTSVTMPTAMVRIGDRAFADCTSISEITINNYAEVVGANVFSGWTEAQTIKFAATQFEVVGEWNIAWSNGCKAKCQYAD